MTVVKGSHLWGATKATNINHSGALQGNITGDTFEDVMQRTNTQATVTYSGANYKWYNEGAAGTVVGGDPQVSKIVVWGNQPGSQGDYNTTVEGWVALKNGEWIGKYNDDNFGITP